MFDGYESTNTIDMTHPRDGQKERRVQLTTNSTVLVGDDTDLIVLLCYHASLGFHDLFFCPKPKKNTK